MAKGRNELLRTMKFQGKKKNTFNLKNDPQAG